MARSNLKRIDIRIEEAKKSVIVKAAEIKGQNISQYIMSQVWPDAQKIVNENTAIKLSARDWKHFCDKLDAPARNLPKLKQLINRPSRFKRRLKVA